MKTKKLFVTLFTFSLALTGCNNGGSSSGGGSGTSGSQEQHTKDEVEKYMDDLKANSEDKHFYLHYYRYAQNVADYNKWDVWSWPYLPKAGEGYRFDWKGRTTNATNPEKAASGNAEIDSFGYVVCDIDLTKEYNGGWNNDKKTIGGKTTNYYQDSSKTKLDEEIGIQIVESATRTTGSSFWANDSGNVYISLNSYALDNKSGGTSYHVFVSQDKVKEPTATPPTEHVDPFDGDDGTNVTYGKAEYSNVDFTKTAGKKATSPLFYSGSNKAPGKGDILQYGAGVGYQIMVSSFADSDGDGFGDIYGITQKLDYIKDLGVNAIWLTPIQLSDSYHGYDISDYNQVDPKFGSTASPHSNGSKPTSATAMEDYKDLIAEAHKKGMAVVMDLVLNHTAPTNNWFIKSAQLDKDYRGYYQWGNHETDSKNINEDKCWYPYGDHVYSYYAKFGSSMPELNFNYVSTRAAVATIALNWCEIGVDGFRMDAVKHIFMKDEAAVSKGDVVVDDVVKYEADVKDASGKVIHKKGDVKADYSSNLTKNLHFWRQLNSDVKSRYPNCFFVGENFDGNAYNVTPYYEGFDSLFDFYAYFNITTIAAQAKGNISTGPTSAYAWLGNGSSDNHKIEGSVKWDYTSMLAKANSRRGGKAMDGVFTSNHDIARTINRVAGTKSDSNGLTAQGNVTTSNYETYDKYATLVQITELMLPGCTWIYYGDEIGLAGNFPDKDIYGKAFTAESAYADLYYRQPMKWKQGGKVGDGSFTTGYAVTGSGMTVGLDSLNSSNKVPAATANSAHKAAIKAFATAKGTINELITGSIGAQNPSNRYVFKFTRGNNYMVVVNMSNDPVNVSGYGNVVAKFGTASTSSVGAMSAVLLKK